MNKTAKPSNKALFGLPEIYGVMMATSDTDGSHQQMRWKREMAQKLLK